jgi:branched-chain amino acid transport system substrate-binding protein
MSIKPFRIGEINSYSVTRLRAFTGPYRQAMTLAIERVNAAGGLAGRPIELLLGDDKFDPRQAAMLARELISDARVDMLMGTFNSDVALAVSEVATDSRVLFLAGEPRSDALVWDRGSHYVFRLRTSQSMMSAMLVEQLATAPGRRWGACGAAYPAARRFATTFREQIGKVRADLIWADDHIFDQDAFNAEAAIDWLISNDLEVAFLSVLGPSLLELVRCGNARDAFRNRIIVNPLAGEPEYMEPLGLEAPEGWLVLGYPGSDDPLPSNQFFCREFRERFGSDPTFGALLGTILIDTLAAAAERATSLETEDLISALRGLKVATPMGYLDIRAADHQATMGTWLGRLTVCNGAAAMRDWKFLPGNRYLPSEDQAAQLRRPDRKS